MRADFHLQKDKNHFSNLRGRNHAHSSVCYIVAIILLTSATMCGLLFVNLYGRKTVFLTAKTVTTITTGSTEESSEITSDVQADSSYAVRNAEAINNTGEVSNDGTKSKLMEDLMLNIAKKTATKEQ